MKDKYRLPLEERLYHRKYMRQWRKDYPERAKEHYNNYWRKKHSSHSVSEKTKTREKNRGTNENAVV